MHGHIYEHSSEVVRGCQKRRVRRGRSVPPKYNGSQRLVLTFPAGVRLYLATAATDLRRSFDGLSASVQSEFGMAPTSGNLFIFLNRRATRVRILAEATV